MTRKGDMLLTEPHETAELSARFAVNYPGAARPNCQNCGNSTEYIVEPMTHDVKGWYFLRPGVNVIFKSMPFAAIVDKLTKTAYIPVPKCGKCP